MSIGKVLGTIAGGAALGVGAIVAAPVFGAVGAVTAVGAAVGAVGGGAAASVAAAGMANAERKQKEQLQNASYNKGYEEGKASNTCKIVKMEKQIQELSNEVERLSKKIVETQGYDGFGKYIMAAFSVALAVANCDGHICDDEREAMQLVIAGESVKALPHYVKDNIIKLAQNPPSFNTALTYVMETKIEYYDSYEQIIREVAFANKQCSAEEYAFIEAWNRTLGRNLKVEAC